MDHLPPRLADNDTPTAGEDVQQQPTLVPSENLTPRVAAVAPSDGTCVGDMDGWARMRNGVLALFSPQSNMTCFSAEVPPLGFQSRTFSCVNRVYILAEECLAVAP